MFRSFCKRYSSRSVDYSGLTTKIANRRRPNLIRKMLKIYTENPGSIFLATGTPNAVTFPFREISVTYKDGTQHRLSGNELDAALQYGRSQGYPPFVEKWREFQVEWHQPPRDDWDIAVTTGSQEAASKIFELFIEEGDCVMLQTPAYTGTLGAMYPLAPKFVDVEQDADGILPEKIRDACEARRRDGLAMPKLLYVNPTGANPTGTVLTEERRREIYRLAQLYDFLIVEDDPYYFLHFLDKRPPSFFSMDTDGRVVRLDSFSKILSAGLRVGVVTAHRDLLGKLILHMESSTLHASSLSQMLVYKLLNSWGVERCERHLDEVRRFYKDRRDVMIASVEKHLTGLAEWSTPNAGMFVWIKIKGVRNIYDLVTNECVTNGLLVVPGNAFHYDTGKPDQHLRLCYSYASAADIDEGLAILAKIIRSRSSTMGDDAIEHSPGDRRRLRLSSPPAIRS